MKRFAQVVVGVLALAAVATAVWAISRGLVLLWDSFAAIPKEIAVALIAAAATVFVSTLTVVLGRYFERKRELDALYRDKKAEIYDEFLKQFFDLLHGNSDAKATSDDMAAFLREFMRKLLLWSGPEAITAFVKWKDNLARGVPDAQTIFVTEEFLLALRKDLRHSDMGIPSGFFARLFLKEADAFLAAAKRNPRVTLAEIAALESTPGAALKKGDS
jgi:hypothetical protein